MKIEELMDKERRAQYQLLLCLYQSQGSIPLKQVMQNSGISKVTLLKYCHHIDDLLQDENLPCRVIVNDDQIILEESGTFIWEKLISVLLKDSLSYQILLYLFNHEHFTIAALSQELLVSEATLNRQLAILNSLLEEFHLSISQGRQVGHELQWRYFYYELFNLSLSLRDKNRFFQDSHQEHLATFSARLLGQELSDTALDKLALWFAISQNRLSFHKEKSIPEQIEEEIIEENVFFKKIDTLLIRYLSRFAVEYDDFESKSLFAFLLAYPILPHSSMSYVLGFGGPISDKIAEALWLMKKADVLTSRTKEDIIYGLGIFFSRAYFFKGVILDGQKSDCALYHLIASEDKARVDLLVQHLMIQLEDKGIHQTDLALFLRHQLLELLIFSLERHHKPLRVALDLGHDTVENAIVELTIRRHLENNRHFHFLKYQKGLIYDCLVTYKQEPCQNNGPSFHLKQYSSPFELHSLEQFLKNQLQEKRVLEENVEQDF